MSIALHYKLKKKVISYSLYPKTNQITIIIYNIMYFLGRKIFQNLYK